MKKQKVALWKAWVSIGTDDHPIQISWWKEDLQNNVFHEAVYVIPIKEFNKMKRCLKMRGEK